MVRLTDRPDMTLDVYRGCKTTIQHMGYTNKEMGASYRIGLPSNTASPLGLFVRIELLCNCSCSREQTCISRADLIRKNGIRYKLIGYNRNVMRQSG